MFKNDIKKNIKTYYVDLPNTGYIKDGTNIEKLYADGYNEWDMAFLTGLPIYVIQEYVEIIKSYEKEKITKLILKINNREMKGSYEPISSYR